MKDVKRVVLVAIATFVVVGSDAKNPIRTAFFSEYPAANGTRLSDLTSNAGHCGVCHYDFDGGGTRNPYGQAIENAISGKDYIGAIRAVAYLDSDGDGATNIVEITDTTTYGNTPTFPGLTAGNIGNVTHVTASEIQDHLTPSTGEDNDPPNVTVLSPNGGETATGDAKTVITWTATDSSGIASVELSLSLDGGASYSPVALNLPNSGSFDWYVANRPSSNALIKVEAVDNALNKSEDESDAVFSVISPSGGIAPTTLRDFDLPGSQPLVDSGLTQANPDSCASCHGGYSPDHEPYMNWMGSMMAQASIDPIFKANMSIANQDAPDSGDLCLRCHNSRGWLDGRSTPTDGSRMLPEDQRGVSCDLCHRLVDPVYQPGLSPIEDGDILDELEQIPAHPGNGMYVFDPNSHRRGPFADSVSPHLDLVSPFHQDAAICGTCHDVSNPVFIRDGTNVEYVANDFDAAPETDSPYELMPVERTYSEWLHSAYNTSNGVYAPQFAGNKPGGMVSTCQDCHMPDIAGHGADPDQYPGAPLRADLPLHDMTGGSVWLPNLLPAYAGLGPNEAAALSNGAHRANYMLEKAARVQATREEDQLKVMVINDTGHKLPTGYPEGRRMWINVQFHDQEGVLISESGGYDYSTGLLTNDTMIYEIHPGIGTNLAAALGDDFDPGPSLHFVLNNQIYEDNRIPPRGFTNRVFETFGGAPTGHHYEDGQYWDNAYFAMPEGAASARVRLYYQSTSKEFIEFLRDENTTDSNGQELYDLWDQNGKCPPVLMTETFWPENFSIDSLWWMVDDSLGIAFNSISGYTYWIEYADQLGSNLTWYPFLSNGLLESFGGTNTFFDDFTPATSGSEPSRGQRFYRIRR